jgi:hypothetical protein
MSLNNNRVIASWLARRESKRTAATTAANLNLSLSRSSGSFSRSSSLSNSGSPTATTAGVLPFFFSAHAPPAGGQVGSSMLGRDNFMTLARIWAMWRAISWLNAHKQFMSLGVVLAEYATKSALSHLPPNQQLRCEHLLNLVGVDVESVGLGAIGQSALSVAMTGSHFDAHAASTADIIHTTPSQQFDVQRLMDELVCVASLPAALDPRQHQCFADALNNNYNNISSSSLQQASVCAYGMPCALWTKGGLHELRRSGGSGGGKKKVTWQQLERAYAESYLAALEAAAWVRALGPSALRIMKLNTI